MDQAPVEILTYASIGLTFGLAGGLSPGPLTALLIGQTLRFGTREGLKVAIVPALTDGPLLIATVYLIGALRDVSGFSASVALVGSVFLLWLAADTFRAGEVEPTTGAGPGGTLRKALMTNVLNPHPYIFWMTVGGPLAAQAMGDSAAALTVYLACFFVGIVGAKAVLAWLVGRYRMALSGPAYRWIMRFLGIALALIAISFVREGFVLLGWLS